MRIFHVFYLSNYSQITIPCCRNLKQLNSDVIIIKARKWIRIHTEVTAQAQYHLKPDWYEFNPKEKVFLLISHKGKVLIYCFISYSVQNFYNPSPTMSHFLHLKFSSCMCLHISLKESIMEFTVLIKKKT
jgi:hypothetical protein